VVPFEIVKSVFESVASKSESTMVRICHCVIIEQRTKSANEVKKGTTMKKPDHILQSRD